jgi:hypothetical protein
MTSLTMHLRLTSPRLRQPWAARQLAMWVSFISGATAVLRPLVVALGIIAAAAMWPTTARADGLGETVSGALNKVGIGNNGPISTAIAGIGQKFCPMLVQPGSKFASMATQVSGHNGLSPDIAGFVTSMAIQMECPSVMTSLANGNMPFGLQLPGANSAPGLPFGLPGANSAPGLPFGLQLPGTNPAPASLFGLPGTNPAPASPFALPGTNPAPPSPFQIPGL